MICQFQMRAAHAAQPAGGQACPQPVLQPCQGDLSPLLGSLRGRHVTVVFAGHCVTGKVVTTNPLTLVDGQGQVTVLAAGVVQSVQF